MTQLNLLSPEVRANPYPFYRELRRNHPVCRVAPGNFWAISRYADIRRVLGDPQTFSSEGLRALLLPPWLKSNPLADSLLVLDPPEHTRHRSFIHHAFSARSMGRFEPRIRAIANELAVGLGRNDVAEFMTQFAGPLPARVMAELLGLDPVLHVHFKRWTEDLAAISPAITDPHRIDAIHTTLRAMTGYLTDVIAARRACPREDMLSDLLLRQSEAGALTDNELLALLFVLLPAGLETTMYLLANAVRVLCEHPEVLARLSTTPALIPYFVDEVLRFDSPGHGTFRVCRNDVRIDGQTIAKGEVLLLLMASSGRDEAAFSNPDVFNLDRQEGRTLAFGHDIHFCLGAPLARLEARIALEVLVARFSHLAAPPDTIEWNQSLTVRGPTHMQLRLSERQATARVVLADG